MHWQERTIKLICELKGMKTTLVKDVPQGKRAGDIRHTEIDPDALVKSRSKTLGGDVPGAQQKVSHLLSKIRKGKVKGHKRSFYQKGGQTFGRGVLGLEQDPPSYDPGKKPVGPIKRHKKK